MAADVFHYAKPLRNVKQEDCFFYHRTDLPGVGEVGTQWDLRAETDQYLGNIDFKGKRVLDVGAASGYLTFQMESRGAEVVSFDMKDGSYWNIVPQAEIQDSYEEALEGRQKCHETLKNAYWFSHEKLKSKAQVYYGDVYNLPLELGQFDLVFFGMILGHLRDPFQALYSASRLCKGSIMVTNQWVPIRRSRFFGRKQPSATFMPTRKNGATDCWWSLSDQCISNMLEVLGFDTVGRVTSQPECLVENRQQKERCVSTIADRKRGHAVGICRQSLSEAG